MSIVSCEAMPPSSLQIVDGQRVYRSVHAVAVINDSGEDISYDVESILFDSAGHSQSTSVRNQIAPGDGSQSSVVGPFFVDLDANLYNSGDQITFTAETHVTRALSAVDRKTKQLTIE